MRGLSCPSRPRGRCAAHGGAVRGRRLLLGLVGVLLVITVALGWSALSPAAVRPDPVPEPIRISEPAPTGSREGATTPDPPAATVVPPGDPDVVPPPPLVEQDDDVEGSDDGGDGDD